MDGSDFHEVAWVLVAGLREAEWRSAVSRAYYAAFHVARQLLLHCGFRVPRGDQAHAYLWLRLINSGHPDVHNAGLNLNHLRRVRNRADYDLDRPLDQAAAVAQVQAAADIIPLLKSVPTTPTVQTQITEAIQTYERDVLRQVTWQP
jgi:uncharacterized protein (UPF0332 family)